MAYNEDVATGVRHALAELDVQALTEPHTRVMDFTGRPMTGMICVTEAGLRGDGLSSWVRRGLEHTSTLAPK